MALQVFKLSIPKPILPTTGPWSQSPGTQSFWSFCWWERANTQVWTDMQKCWKGAYREGRSQWHLHWPQFSSLPHPNPASVPGSSWTRDHNVSVRRSTPDRHNRKRSPPTHTRYGERNGWEGGRKEDVNFLWRDGGKQLALNTSLLPGPGLPPLDSCSAKSGLHFLLPYTILSWSLFEAKIAKGKIIFLTWFKNITETAASGNIYGSMSSEKLVRTDLYGFIITKGDFLLGSNVAEAGVHYRSLRCIHRPQGQSEKMRWAYFDGSLSGV